MKVRFTEELRDIVKKSMPVIASTIDKFPNEIDGRCKVDDVEIRLTSVCGVDGDIIFSVSYTKELMKNYIIKFSAQISFQVKDEDIIFKSYFKKELYGFSFTIIRFEDYGDFDIASVKLPNVEILDDKVIVDIEWLASLIVRNPLVYKTDDEIADKTI